MDQYFGEIRMFAGLAAPGGWMICDGRKLPVRENPMLYATIGNTFGGTLNVDFALPDLRDALVVGSGATAAGAFPAGHTGGSNSLHLAPHIVAAHSHALHASTDQGSSAVPGPSVGFAGVPVGDRFYNLPTPADPGTLAPLSGLALSASGQGAPIDNRMPCAAINFIICVSGFAPNVGD